MTINDTAYDVAADAATVGDLIAELNRLHDRASDIEAELAPGMAAGDPDAFNDAATVLDSHYDIVDRLADRLATVLRVPDGHREHLAHALIAAMSARISFEWMFDDEGRFHDFVMDRGQS